MLKQFAVAQVEGAAHGATGAVNGVNCRRREADVIASGIDIRRKARSQHAALKRSMLSLWTTPASRGTVMSASPAIGNRRRFNIILEARRNAIPV